MYVEFTVKITQIKYQLYYYRCLELLKSIAPSHDETWFVYIVPGFKNRKGKWKTLLPLYLEYIIYLNSHFDMFGLNFFSNFRCPLAAQDEGCNIGLARIWRYLSLHKQYHHCILTFAFILVIWIDISNKFLLGHTRIVGIVDWGDLANPWETAYIANLQKNLQGINNRIHS